MQIEMHKKRILKTYCDGGFGNRLNGLITGMAFAKIHNLELEIVWPLNNWCGASFEAIFDNSFTVTDRELKTFVIEKGKYHYLMTEDHLRQEVDYLSPLMIQTLDELAQSINSSSMDIFLHTPLIPQYLPPDLIYECINSLCFRQEYTEACQKFIDQNKLDIFYGIQIRKTDFGPHGADEKNLFQLISAAPSHRFFVCSDDSETEEAFRQLRNVVIYEKSAHVQKMKLGDWSDLTADFSGRVYASNINRNEQSVRDAVVDLLILSHSQIVRTSGSTFLSASLLLKAARAWALEHANMHINTA